MITRLASICKLAMSVVFVALISGASNLKPAVATEEMAGALPSVELDELKISFSTAPAAAIEGPMGTISPGEIEKEELPVAADPVEPEEEKPVVAVAPVDDAAEPENEKLVAIAEPDEEATESDEHAADPDEDAAEFDEDAADPDADAAELDEDAAEPDEDAAEADEDTQELDVEKADPAPDEQGPLPVRAPHAGESNNLFAGHSWYTPPPPQPQREAPPPAQPVRYEPAAPPLPYELLGSYEQRGSPTLYFLVKEDRVYDVAIGDTLDNTYRVDGLTNGQLMFTYLPLNTSQGLRLGEE